jgi:hypothetical protein
MRQCGTHTNYTVALPLQPWLCENATIRTFSFYFMFEGLCIVKYMSIIFQQDAQQYTVYLYL